MMPAILSITILSINGITLHNTFKIVTLDGGVSARIWEGHTESEIPVYAYIKAVQIVAIYQQP
jgi:hypothetical protein